jgi:hypothetical protein
MKDVPQPASDPYQLGDDVQVYVSETDPDSEHHGKEGTITDVLQDNLGDKTVLAEGLKTEIEKLVADEATIDRKYDH